MVICTGILGIPGLDGSLMRVRADLVTPACAPALFDNQKSAHTRTRLSDAETGLNRGALANTFRILILGPFSCVCHIRTIRAKWRACALDSQADVQARLRIALVHYA